MWSFDELTNCYLRFETCLKQEVVVLVKVVILTAPKSAADFLFKATSIHFPSSLLRSQAAGAYPSQCQVKTGYTLVDVFSDLFNLVDNDPIGYVFFPI